MSFHFEKISHKDEREFRKQIERGEKPTFIECYRHLEYTKKYGKSSFANRFNAPIIPHPNRISHPKGEVYRDDIEPKENNNSKTFVLKK